MNQVELVLALCTVALMAGWAVDYFHRMEVLKVARMTMDKVCADHQSHLKALQDINNDNAKVVAELKSKVEEMHNRIELHGLFGAKKNLVQGAPRVP